MLPTLLRRLPTASRLTRLAVVSATSLFMAGTLASCASNEELKARLEQRNEKYSKFQERREIRNDAMDERYRAHYERVMN